MKTIRPLAVALPVLLVALAIRAPSAHAEAIVFEDGDFDAAAWDMTLLPLRAGGTASALQVPTGGNPDAYRRVEHTVNDAASPSENASIWVFHESLSASVDPAAVGGIQSVSMFLDVLGIQDTFGAGGVTLALRQGETIYASGSLIQASGSDPSWRALEWVSVPAVNFGAYQGPEVGLPGTPDPDFSSSGAPITFGFATLLPGGIGGQSFSTAAGYDNWRLEVEPVPEVTSAILMGFAVLLGLLTRARAARGA